jgi:hypothetical protein
MSAVDDRDPDIVFRGKFDGILHIFGVFDCNAIVGMLLILLRFASGHDTGNLIRPDVWCGPCHVAGKLPTTFWGFYVFGSGS